MLSLTARKWGAGFGPRPCPLAAVPPCAPSWGPPWGRNREHSDCSHPAPICPGLIHSSSKSGREKAPEGPTGIVSRWEDFAEVPETMTNWSPRPLSRGPWHCRCCNRRSWPRPRGSEGGGCHRAPTTAPLGSVTGPCQTVGFGETHRAGAPGRNRSCLGVPC